MTAREVRVLVLAPAKWISANDRGSWHAKAAKTALWREATRVQVLALRAGQIPPPVEVHVLVHRTSNRRSDALNTADTFKACLDGCVEAGLLEDDHDGVIARTIFERGPNKTRPALTLTITPIDLQETA